MKNKIIIAGIIIAIIVGIIVIVVLNHKTSSFVLNNKEDGSIDITVQNESKIF